MLLETLNTFAALATLLVIAVAAFAAVVQLRHLRISNQLNGLLTVLHYSQDPEEQHRRTFVLEDLDAKLSDREFRKELMQHPVDPRRHVELSVCDFFEQIGNYVKHGLIDEDAYLDTASGFVETMWEKLEPVIAIMRRTRDQTLYDNFEYLAARSQLWLSRHPRGNYPRNTDRLNVRDKWLETDGASPLNPPRKA